ncbi:polyketide synthase/peptide synthetase [Paraphaeosphaeria minitans]|uniref:Polyketide synthase/peptide synthetase n=1 Tax=Paraphaeosphaeria minitans TaxID=565426 RepID=A0A9P6G5I4_9PLEO|nr:polyketide synthase/peptide synthetase [Paraphaeosphaeria minitans]
MASNNTSNADNRLALPLIGSLINLSTVFRDKAFTNIPYNAFQAVGDVKDKENLFLHNNFSNALLKLFILTSSLSYIAGDPRQANYNARNAFMASLAQCRLSTGLPTPVVHLARIPSRREICTGSLLIHSGVDPETITGLKDVDRGLGDRLDYVKEPMFRIVVRDSSGDIGLLSSVEVSKKLSLRQQLAAAIVTDANASEVEVAVPHIVRKAFIEKWKALLQVGFLMRRV